MPTRLTSKTEHPNGVLCIAHTRTLVSDSRIRRSRRPSGRTGGGSWPIARALCCCSTDSTCQAKAKLRRLSGIRGWCCAGWMSRRCGIEVRADSLVRGCLKLESALMGVGADGAGWICHMACKRLLHTSHIIALYFPHLLINSRPP